MASVFNSNLINGGAHGVIVSVAGNRFGGQNSNPRRGRLLFTYMPILPKGISTSYSLSGYIYVVGEIRRRKTLKFKPIVLCLTN